ncbi:MAG TPA: hypothetical protein VLF60_04555 [Candidatus Saccharimonadales bacterium]|nr:hypothetical protein [Candidatus Saccharimonadales bacterium]
MKVRRSLPLSAVLVGCFSTILVVAGLAGVYTLLHRHTQKNPFTVLVQSNAQTQLYYPTKLPGGYTMDPSRVSQPQKGVTVMSFTAKGKPPIYMSQQAVPSGFDMGTFTKNFEDASHITAQAGQGTVGKLTDAQKTVHVASLVSNDKTGTWIILNAPTDVSTKTLQQIAEALVKVPN